MNQQEILKKIGGIITELKDQYTYLEAAGNSFNDLELELFMANASFLTDHIQILKKVHNQPIPPAMLDLPAEKVYGKRDVIPDYFSEEEQLVYTEDQLPGMIKPVPAIENPELNIPETTEPEVAKSESMILPEAMPANEIKDVPIVKDASFTEQKTVEAEKPMEVEIPKVEAIKEAIVQPETYIQPVNLPPEPGVFFEEKKVEPVKQEPLKLESEPVLTLNQRIAAQRGLDQSKTTVAETSNKIKPAQDLQSLISLNDKLLFVKELFNGYNLAYTEAINILNRYTTFDQAEKFLNQNYSVKNNWKEKPAASEKFFDLLRKKFS